MYTVYSRCLGSFQHCSYTPVCRNVLNLYFCIFQLYHSPPKECIVYSVYCLVSGTLQNRLSHHHPIFHFSNILCSDDAAKTILKQHYNFSKSNLERFIEVFSGRVHNFSTVDKDFNAFQKIFTNAMDESCKLDKPKTTKRNIVSLCCFRFI